ncbi:hypothetical protein [Microvirga brassicacearum]|uniref:Uncharacterized protein n=1 Tax=Microvirga brassicacearum TaxID=2580413 RepID=A0A5N3PF97_9HYPH|nr:hypothetical protein [Microvirga brassicacearum]KAB0268325.1 hypothetical protein FEZ63_04820 [Microvirga brassicacearum]
MSRATLAIACLLALGLAGCAVSGSVSTASIRAEGDEVTVQSSEWGGAVACGAGGAGDPACSAAPIRQRFP